MVKIQILLLLLATLADHPRLHVVEGRSLNNEADIATTTEIYDELTTQNAIADVQETTIAPETTTTAPTLLKSINATTTASSLTESNNNGITLDISR